MKKLTLIGNVKRAAPEENIIVALLHIAGLHCVLPERMPLSTLFSDLTGLSGDVFPASPGLR